VAPGEFIISARSNSVPESTSDPDPYHRVLAGTSMATPHVVGIIALMLQYEPNLPAIEIPQILRETARLDSFTGLIAMGSGVWGFGKADARTATGLFRDTVVINGIPPTVNATLDLNRTRTVDVPGESWTDFYFAKNTTFTIAPIRQVQATSDTRYEFENEDSVGTHITVLLLNYRAQFLLTVNAPFGPVNGAGWYDANSVATINAPETVLAPGIAGCLGVHYVLSYLLADNGTKVSNTVLMNGPQSVTATYTLEVPERTMLSVLIVAIVFDLAAILFARKKLS
jgi:hypothetical protein